MTPLRVLFLCVGNSVRSQMAEGFAKLYGSDVLSVQSAGLSPAEAIAPSTRRTMAEKNISLDRHFPKSFEIFNPQQFDLVVNMSGYPLPKGMKVNSVQWPIPDPLGKSEEAFRKVRDDIERRVMRLILEERMKISPPSPPPPML